MRLWLRIGAALSIAFAAAAVLAAPANVGGGLRQIADEAELGPTQAAARALAGTPSISNSAHVQRDVHGHVGVSIYLNGRSTLADTVAKLKALGAEVNATTDSVQF